MGRARCAPSCPAGPPSPPACAPRGRPPVARAPPTRPARPPACAPRSRGTRPRRPRSGRPARPRPARRARRWRRSTCGGVPCALRTEAHPPGEGNPPDGPGRPPSPSARAVASISVSARPGWFHAAFPPHAPPGRPDAPCHPQRRHHRPRGPRQDHAGGPPAAPAGAVFRDLTRGRAADDGQERPGARARHHDLLEELRHRATGARADQPDRHPRPRRLRRRGGARAEHGRRRAAAGGRLRGPDAADALRAAQGAAQRARAAGRDQQDRPQERARRRRCSTWSTGSSSSWARTTTTSSSRCSTPRAARASRAARWTRSSRTCCRSWTDPRARARAPRSTRRRPLQLPVCDVDVDNYVGRIAIGRAGGRPHRTTASACWCSGPTARARPPGQRAVRVPGHGARRDRGGRGGRHRARSPAWRRWTSATR